MSIANCDAQLSYALIELLKLIEAQYKEAPSQRYRDALESEIGLVRGWIDAFASEVNILSVAQELYSVSKAIDAYYPWSNLSSDREQVISQVWESAQAVIKHHETEN